MVYRYPVYGVHVWWMVCKHQYLCVLIGQQAVFITSNLNFFRLVFERNRGQQPVTMLSAYSPAQTMYMLQFRANIDTLGFIVRITSLTNIKVLLLLLKNNKSSSWLASWGAVRYSYRLSHHCNLYQADARISHEPYIYVRFCAKILGIFFSKISADSKAAIRSLMSLIYTPVFIHKYRKFFNKILAVQKVTTKWIAEMKYIVGNCIVDEQNLQRQIYKRALRLSTLGWALLTHSTWSRLIDLGGIQVQK